MPGQNLGSLYDDAMDPVGALKRHNPLASFFALPGAATDAGTAQGRYDSGKIGAGELTMAYGTYGLKLAEAATLIYGAGKAIGALAEAEGIVGACKGECFEAGTLVSFAESDKAGQWQTVLRPIETAHTGEQVLSRSEATGKTEIKRIVSTSHSHVDATVSVELADAVSGHVVETITGTRQHPFYVEGKGFVPAGALAIGNSIVTRAGPGLVVKRVTWNRRAQGYDVYNFVVEDDHSYFVGKANGGAWVHNVACPPGFSRVGRWMSEAEHDSMVSSGTVQESTSGTTHVAHPADPTAFNRQAKPGSIYVEFDVPSSSVVPSGNGWGKIVGPNSLEGRLAKLKGLPIPQMPTARNIIRGVTK